MTPTSCKYTRTVKGHAGPIAITIEMDEDDWTPDRIQRLRSTRGQTQTAFGLDLCDVNEGSAQTIVSRLETGKVKPSAAMRRTFQRMEEGQI